MGLAKALVPAVAAAAAAAATPSHTARLSIISIPTTFSGSEATNIYGVARRVAMSSGSNNLSSPVVRKVAARDERVRPKLVFYDSTLLRSLPFNKIIPSVFNALAHAVEALWARDVGPFSSMGALESVKMALKWLPVLHYGSQAATEEAIDYLLYSAYLAGTALDQEEMALQHRLAHVLGGSYHLPHAETHMTILPHVIHYNQSALPAKIGVELLTDDVAGTFYDLQVRLVSSTVMTLIGSVIKTDRVFLFVISGGIN